MAQSFSHTELAEILGMKPTTLYTLNIKNPKVLKQIKKYFNLEKAAGPGGRLTYSLKKGFQLDDAVKGVQTLMGKTLTVSRPDIIQFITKEVANANAGEKFVSIEEIFRKVEKKFKGIKPTSGIRLYPVLENLDTRAQKADQVLRNMLMENKPLNGLWHEVAAKRIGMNTIAFRRMLEGRQYGNLSAFEKVPTYLALKDQGADIISQGIPKARGSYDFIKKLSFSGQLAKALEIREGMPILNLGESGSRGNTPRMKTMTFAFRNWVLNQGKGAVELFDKNGDKITYEFGKVHKVGDISFKYKGNTFSLRDRPYKVKNISDPAILKTYFPEVEKITNELNSFGQKKIENPFKPGSKILVRDLIRKIQVDGYGYKTLIWNFSCAPWS